MKTLLGKIGGAIALVGICSLLLAAGSAAAADQKMAVVDLSKVFDRYYKTIRSTQYLKQEATEMQKERSQMVDAGKKTQAEWQKLLDKSEDQAFSAEERGRNKKAAEEKFREVKAMEEQIQEYDRSCSQKIHEKEHQRHDDIVKEIRNVLNAEAKAAGYTLVFDISGESANTVPVVLYANGLPDLTESLLKELNASAPTATTDETPGFPNSR